MSHENVRVFGPKVFDASLAKKILSPKDDDNLSEGEDSLDQGSTQMDHVVNGANLTDKEDEIHMKGLEDYEFFNHMQEVLTQLALERRQKDVCLAKLKEIESELHQFSSEFLSKLNELRESETRFVT